MIVLDGSTDSEALYQNKRLCDEYGVRYNVYDRRVSQFERWLDGARQVETELVCVVPDDDFLLPEGLEKAVGYLKTHPDYASAQGYYTYLLLEEGQFWFEPHFWTTRKSIEADDPLERLIDFYNHYSDVIYAVHRREHLQFLLEQTVQNYSDSESFVFMEFLFGAMTALKGKVKVLDVPYSLRQRGQANHQKLCFDRYIYTADFLEKYQKYKASVIAYARDRYRADPETVDAVVDYAFGMLLSILFLHPKQLKVRALRHLRPEPPREGALGAFALLGEMIQDLWQAFATRLVFYIYVLPQKHPAFHWLANAIYSQHPDFMDIHTFLRQEIKAEQHEPSY